MNDFISCREHEILMLSTDTNFDLQGIDNYSITRSSCLVATLSSTFIATCVTLPAAVVIMGFSIFMASRINNSCPSITSSPSFTCTFQIVPGMGAKISVLIFISFIQNILGSLLAGKSFSLKQDSSGLYLKKSLKSSGVGFYDKRLASF